MVILNPSPGIFLLYDITALKWNNFNVFYGMSERVLHKKGGRVRGDILFHSIFTGEKKVVKKIP